MSSATDNRIAATGEKQGLLSYLASTFWVKSPTGKSRYIFPGWWTVFISAAQTFFSAPLNVYSQSVFLRAMSDQFHWTAVQISFLTVLTREEGAFEGPIVGWILDRWGPRAVSAAGWAVCALGYLMLPALVFFNGNIIWMYICFSIVYVSGASGVFYPSMYKAANNWFIKNRGMAIGATTVGSGFGTPLIIPVVAFLIAQYGWITTAYMVGILMLGMGVPASYLVFRKDKPEDIGLLPDNEPVVAAPPPAAVVAETAAPAETSTLAVPLKEFGVREALRSPSFWLWTVGGMIIGIGGGANFVNFQSIRLQEVGFSIEAAALYFGLSFIFTQVGRLLATGISDIIHPALGYGMSLVMEGIGIYCFAEASNSWWLWGYVILYGIGYGYSIPASAILAGGLFGREGFARIRGLNAMINAFVTIPGPLLFGFLREWSGAYYLPFALGGIAYVVGGFVIMFARTPKGQIQPGRRGSTAGAH